MAARRIAVFHPSSGVGSAWCCADGIVETLRAMGHTVTSFTDTSASLDVLRGQDLILLASLEWYADKLAAMFGAGWHGVSVPKVAWYVESFERDDRSFDFSQCRPMADRHYFPAAQDAEAFGGTWLPFGADVTLFKPSGLPKLYDAAFLGTIYPKRAEYVGRITCPITHIQSVNDPDKRRSVELLAYAYGTPRIFINLPAYSRLLVTKVTEVMACGTLLLTPKLDHPSALRNMEPFEDRRHLVYYDPDRPEEIGAIVAHYLAHPEEREAIAAAGLAEVRQRHTLAMRLQQLLDEAALRQAA